MNIHEKLSVVSFSRGLERGEGSCIRPLTQLLIKRKFYQPTNLPCTSQNKIEVITNSNFVIRKHCPVANPFKDFPCARNESFMVHRKKESPKRAFDYLQKKSGTVKKRNGVRRKTSHGRVQMGRTLDGEMISGWIGFRDSV